MYITFYENFVGRSCKITIQAKRTDIRSRQNG